MKDIIKVKKLSEDLLQCSEYQYREIKKAFGKSDIEIEECIKILREWIKQNPHLPDIENDDKLLKFLSLNKFQIEKTKMKLDNYYTLRNLIPDLFVNREPRHPSMQKLMNTISFMPMPKLTEDYARVHVIKLLDTNPENFEPSDFFKMTIVIAEMRLFYDTCLGDHVVFDFSNTKIGHLIKVTPMMIKQTQTITEKALSDRIWGIHYLFPPQFATAIINLTKSIYKSKITNRIHIHKDLSTLHQMISKKVLPSDYEGEERSIKELQELWKEFLEEHNEWFLKEGSVTTNEKLRPADISQNDILGYQGTFRKLELD